MEDDYDSEELEIVLGLKNKKDEINKIIANKNGLSFIGAISKLLYNENSNLLYEKNEEEAEKNGMLSDFSLKMGINSTSTVKIKEYESSKFANIIKGDDSLLHESNINYSKEYIQKLKNDFVEKKEEIIEPIEIKANYYNNNKDYYRNKKNKKDYKRYESDYDKNRDKKYNNKNNYYEKKKNKSTKIEKEDEKKENNEVKERKEENEEINFYENEDIKEEDSKKEDIKENKGKEDIEYEEDNNEKSYKKKETNYHSSYSNSNKRNYHNKNKGHKAYRQNANAKRQFK